MVCVRHAHVSSVQTDQRLSYVDHSAGAGAATSGAPAQLRGVLRSRLRVCSCVCGKVWAPDLRLSDDETRWEGSEGLHPRQGLCWRGCAHRCLRHARTMRGAAHGASGRGWCGATHGGTGVPACEVGRAQQLR